MLQRDLLRLLESPAHERDRELALYSLEVERTDSVDAFRELWRKIKAKLGIAAESTARNVVTVSTREFGIPGPTPNERLLIETFQNLTIGYARNIIRDQVLAARTLLDAPTPTLLSKAESRTYYREQILKTFDAYENRMRLVSDNELLRLNADLNKSRQVMAGIQQYVWTTCLDDRVRPRHQQLEGQVCDWAHAPDPGYAPGEDYRCRCLAFPVLDDTYFLVRNQAFA